MTCGYDMGISDYIRLLFEHGSSLDCKLLREHIQTFIGAVSTDATLARDSNKKL